MFKIKSSRTLRLLIHTKRTHNRVVHMCIQCRFWLRSKMCINVSFLVFCTHTLHLKMMQLYVYRCISVVIFQNIKEPHLTNRQKVCRVISCTFCTVYKNLKQFAVETVSSQIINWIDLVEITHRFSELHVHAIMWCYKSNRKVIPFTLVWMKLF